MLGDRGVNGVNNVNIEGEHPLPACAHPNRREFLTVCRVLFLVFLVSVRQANDAIASVDPLLLKLLQYRNAGFSPQASFASYFHASTRDLFTAFAEAQQELAQQEKISVQLWANLEAFEYTRYNPCRPVDVVGT